jgi:hypothetical protein
MGGPQAELTPEQGAKGLVDVVEKLTSEQSGKFLNVSQ